MKHDQPDRLDQTLQAAISAGILPETATRPEQDSRPWPVVLLTALGAWLAAIPLMIVVGLFVFDSIHRGAGAYVVGVLGLGAAVMLLRAQDLSLFVEQLAMPALMVGGSMLAIGLFRDLPNQLAAALLALTAAAVVWAVPKPWLRVLLGAAAAAFTGLACLPGRWNLFDRSESTGFWIALHAILAIWLAAGWIQRNRLNHGARADLAAAWESVSLGWLLLTLAGLALWSGMTFLVGASAGYAGEVWRELSPGALPTFGLLPQRLVSVALAAGAAAWLARAWPMLRQAWCAAVAAVLILLAWFMPSLGAVWLALAICAGAARWRTAAAAGVAAAWIIGAFYYQLAWPLATKSLLLLASGAVLGAFAWLGWRMEAAQSIQDNTAASLPAGRGVMAGIGLSLLAVLLAANISIWQKESIIAHGQPVYIALAPVDPRSLMQGDYMALDFRLPLDGMTNTENLLGGKRPYVVARRDAQGIATLLRIDQGTPLSAGEFRIQLTPKNGRWTLVTDAWFFKEGEGERWARARHGEFRVDASGKALLVGLRGEQLQAL